MNNIDQLNRERQQIIKNSMKIDYSFYETGNFAFRYEDFMKDYSFDIETIHAIQKAHGAAESPLKELKNITALARINAKKGYGARIFMKDEACLDSGSFKARRASMACYQAKQLGYKGVIAATSGNYGAAVASQAAKYGLKCIIVQETYDSLGIGQPEIIEKARACEAYGAEVIQLSVGPELFYVFLDLLKQTNYFNASLYSPYGIAGIETLGKECIEDCLRLTNQLPKAIIVTNAGGGNVTGTARGVLKTTNEFVQIIAASVNLKGLHMANDQHFNKKSFTTGHTGFGIPFAVHPDRSDVPRSAARPLRYMDRYVMVSQGQVFYTTEALSYLEGLERGPAGNTSLAAAIALAKEFKAEDIIIVQETEYTGAGKHHQAQLTFAKQNGISLLFGNPLTEIPGETIVFPRDPSMFQVEEISLDELKVSYLKRILSSHPICTRTDLQFLADECKLSFDSLLQFLDKAQIPWEEQDEKTTSTR